VASLARASFQRGCIAAAHVIPVILPLPWLNGSLLPCYVLRFVGVAVGEVLCIALVAGQGLPWLRSFEEGPVDFGCELVAVSLFLASGYELLSVTSMFGFGYEWGAWVLPSLAVPLSLEASYLL